MLSAQFFFFCVARLTFNHHSSQFTETVLESTLSYHILLVASNNLGCVGACIIRHGFQDATTLNKYFLL